AGGWLAGALATLTTPPRLEVLPELLRPPTPLIPVLAGLCAYLLARALPLGHRFRPLWEEVDELEAPLLGRARPPAPPPAGPRLVAVLRPLVDDLGRLVGSLRAAVGWQPPARLEVELDLVRP